MLCPAMVVSGCYRLAISLSEFILYLHLLKYKKYFNVVERNFNWVLFTLKNSLTVEHELFNK